jgi:hypothetical protein
MENETQTQTQTQTQTWSIDRTKSTKSSKGPRMFKTKRVVAEEVPDVVAQMVVDEVLTMVGNSDWRDPANVSKTIATMMSIDIEKPIEGQVPRAFDIDRTIFVPANKDSDIPFWICQSIIRVDEKYNNRFIDYKGAKYNKIDIIFDNDYFKKQMDIVANAAHCIWNAKWGNSRNEETRLYQKTRTGSNTGDESWLDKCVRHLLTEKDTDGINIKNLVMISFKRNLENA